MKNKKKENQKENIKNSLNGNFFMKKKKCPPFSLNPLLKLNLKLNLLRHYNIK
jgi:hypothetical protein